jgi:hypothetical protein
MLRSVWILLISIAMTIIAVVIYFTPRLRKWYAEMWKSYSRTNGMMKQTLNTLVFSFCLSSNCLVETFIEELDEFRGTPFSLQTICTVKKPFYCLRYYFLEVTVLFPRVLGVSTAGRESLEFSWNSKPAVPHP